MMTLEDLPKISLHDHLDGGLRPETIIEIAKREGIDLPAETPEALADWFFESCTGGDLTDYLATFELTLSVMQRPEDLRRIAYEFALDLADDGVIYAEVRYAPEQHQRGGLSLSAVVSSVQAGFEEAMIEVRGEGMSLRVQQIVCAMRQGTRSLEVAQLAIDYRDAGIVGLDLAGPEEGYPAADHAEALELLARHHMPTTLHAGEASGLESVQGALFQRAVRIGHGARIADDLTRIDGDKGELFIELGDTAAWVRDREIALEMCVTSNLQTGASPWGEHIEDHPFDVFYQLGMCVTVNTDNRLMSDTTLSNELAMLSEAFGYDLPDLLQFQVNAALSAFLPLEERLELVDELEEGFLQVEMQLDGDDDGELEDLDDLDDLDDDEIDDEDLDDLDALDDVDDGDDDDDDDDDDDNDDDEQD